MSEYKREAISDLLRYYILNRDHFQCRYCNDVTDGKNANIDHVRPVSDGGKNYRCNLVTSCAECNSAKHAKVDEIMIHKIQMENAKIELAGWQGSIDPPFEIEKEIKKIMMREEWAWMKAIEKSCMVTNCYVDRIEIALGLSTYLELNGKIK